MTRAASSSTSAPAPPTTFKWFGDGWSNEEIDRLYDEALATADVAERLEEYQRIQEIIAEDVPNLYTVQPTKFQVATQRVEGMYVSYTDFNTGLRTAWDGRVLRKVGPRRQRVKGEVVLYP